MKRTSVILLTALLLTGVTDSTMAGSGPLEKQILKLQPQADTNGDGKLSKAEEAALNETILKRFPQADADGDGVLSVEEQQAVIRRATAREKQQGRQTRNAQANRAKGLNPPTHANVKYGEHERNVFDIWLADSAKPTPLAIYIHGGGFRAGSKENLTRKKQLQNVGVAPVEWTPGAGWG